MRPLLPALATVAILSAQTPPNPEPPKPDAPKVEAPKAEAPRAVAPRPAAAAAEPRIKPYDTVITKEAKTSPGIFTVHQLKDRTYYEIPAAEFGRDFLWVQQIARTTLGVGYGGQSLGYRVVRWERRDRKILLRDVNYDIVADPAKPIAQAVAAANVHTILQAFPIEAEGKDKSVVIDVTRMFLTEVPELSARTRLRARGFDSNRSFIDRVAAFPTNIEVEATHTYTAPPEAAAPASAGPRPAVGLPVSMRGNSATIIMHYSMVKLPEKPMMPRLLDERVGFFNVRKTDFGLEEQNAPKVAYITRWRLEKKDPAAPLSEPVKPIVYYVDPATPTQWIPYVKAGIEAWQPAFEAAGFRNAILAREAPRNDPNWSAEDARYSVIRWLPSEIENAVGPHVHDPRTGEILDADVQFYHNVMKLARTWYFTQVAPLDTRAQKLPLPEPLMGKLIEFVVAHEVGHTLGFPHNFKASSMYPAAKVRDKEWVRKMGHTPSIMDYARFNYVAQPEDGIAVEDLVPRVGPYDVYATMWGYRPVPGAGTPAEERRTLNEWARQQDTTPWFRFTTASSRGADPGEVTEAIGDADPVASSGLGVKNLERVMKLLVPAVEQPGDDWEPLGDLYGRVLSQWLREMLHVAGLVGGVDSQQKNGGQPGVLFTTVPRPRQQQAVAFLHQQVFATPKFLLDPAVLRRVEPSGAMGRIRIAQTAVLESLLSIPRLDRMAEQEVIDGASAYPAADLLADVRRGLFSELQTPAPRIDGYRRNVQLAFLELAGQRIANGAPAQRWLYRGELKTVQSEIARTLPRTADRATRLYLEDYRDQITQILDPKFAPPAGAGLAGRLRTALEAADPDRCWQDFVVESDGIRIQ